MAYRSNYTWRRHPWWVDTLILLVAGYIAGVIIQQDWRWFMHVHTQSPIKKTVIQKPCVQDSLQIEFKKISVLLKEKTTALSASEKYTNKLEKENGSLKEDTASLRHENDSLRNIKISKRTVPKKNHPPICGCPAD